MFLTVALYIFLQIFSSLKNSKKDKNGNYYKNKN